MGTNTTDKDITLSSAGAPGSLFVHRGISDIVITNLQSRAGSAGTGCSGAEVWDYTWKWDNIYGNFPNTFGSTFESTTGTT